MDLSLDVLNSMFHQQPGGLVFKLHRFLNV